MPLPITSLQNNRIKNIVKLHNRRARAVQQLTPVEGAREIGFALGNGFTPTEAYLCPELIVSEAATAVAARLQQLEQENKCPLFTIPQALFAKIAYRQEKDGLLILLPFWQRSLAEFTLSANPFLVIIEGGEKPGNLGAILRTADAAHVDAVLVCDADENKGTDIYNPNTIRASLGAVFTVPVITCQTAEVIQTLRENNVLLAATTPDGAQVYTAVNMQGPIALIMGSEARGLSRSWLEAADVHLHIPMFGQVDSLNLSVSTALLLYEVVRQRA